MRPMFARQHCQQHEQQIYDHRRGCKVAAPAAYPMPEILQHAWLLTIRLFVTYMDL
eukprot:CAMPEP_0172859664 /NCGR_PEP_ID=MMETSP1075-20121228/70776_1 /TAXON_ID=2916 /ORGANISM="Ceratium fusus, Strain PA161109" /LENGTH=55 /DNA_ID=CAMNT_0013707535 /DNA_START=101 /DNA_END=264 /DNA_ORIENTATION=+